MLIHIDHSKLFILATQQVLCIVDLYVVIVEEERELIDAGVIVDGLWSLALTSFKLEVEAYLGRYLRALDATEVPDIEPEVVKPTY